MEVDIKCLNNCLNKIQLLVIKITANRMTENGNLPAITKAAGHV